MEKDFMMCIHESRKRLGTILLEDKGVIMYASMKLKTHEELYVTHDLYLVVVLLALKIWRDYPVGRIFVLKSDH